MQEKNRRLFENIISQGALQVVNYILPLITLPYQVRVVGVSNFGLVAFALATVTYLSLIIEYGFTWSATKAISQNRNSINKTSNIFNSVICVKIILAISCFALLSLLIVTIPIFRANWLLLLFTFFLPIGNVVFPNWFFVGQERVKFVTAVTISAKTLFLISLFIFIKRPSDYLFIPLLNGLGMLISGIFGYIYAVKRFNLKIYIPHFSSIKKQFKESTQFFFASIASTLYSNTNAFSLGLTGASIFVGYYSAAEKIYMAIVGIRYPLEVAIYPYMAKNKDMKFYKKIAGFAVLANIFICLALIIIAKPLITLFFGQEMVTAHKLLQIFCIAAMFEFPSVILGYLPLVVYNHKTSANSSVYISSLLHITILIALYLLNNLNMYSVAYLVLFTTAFMCLYRLFFVFKYKILQQN